MPKVPVYGDPRVESRPVATPFANVNADMGLGDVAKGLKQVGRGIDDIQLAQERKDKEAERLREQARQRAGLVDQNNELSALARDADDRLYGAPDAGKKADSWLGIEKAYQGKGASPESLDLAAMRAGKTQEVDLQTHGLVNLRGKDAAAGSVAYLEFLDKRVQERAKNIQDPEARAEFLSKAQPLVNNYRRMAEEHVNKEFAEAQKASESALVDTALRAAAANYGDDANADSQFSIAESSVRASARSDEEADAKAALLRGGIAKARLEQAVAAGDDATAERIFAKAQGDLHPEEAAKYREVITKVRVRREGEETAGGVVDGTRDHDSGFIDEAKALTQFRALPEEKRTPAATQSFARMLQEEEAKKKVVTGQFFDRAFTAFNQRHHLGDVTPGDERWIRKHDPKGWHELEQMQQAQVDRWRSQASRKAPPSQDQLDAYGRLLVGMADDPDRFKTMSVPEFKREWVGQLATDDYEKGLGHLAGIHGKKDGGKGKEEKGTAELHAAVKDSFRREIGLPGDMGKWTPDQARLFARTTDAVSEAERDWKKNNPGKVPTREQYDSWISEQFVKGTVPGSGTLFDDTVSRVEFDANQAKYRGKPFLEKGVPKIEDLPEGATDAITAVLKDRGQSDDAKTQADLVGGIARELRASGREVTPDAIHAVLIDLQGGADERTKDRERSARVNKDADAMLRLYDEGGHVAPTDKRLIGIK